MDIIENQIEDIHAMALINELAAQQLFLRILPAIEREPLTLLREMKEGVRSQLALLAPPGAAIPESALARLDRFFGPLEDVFLKYLSMPSGSGAAN
jgi:hypothetical protein